MTTKDRTPRGFRLFHEGDIVVQESSLAFEGAHCWIRGGRVIDNDGNQGSLHVSVEHAADIVVALEAFISEAKRDELIEPAHADEVFIEIDAPDGIGDDS